MEGKQGAGLSGQSLKTSKPSWYSLAWPASELWSRDCTAVGEKRPCSAMGLLGKEHNGTRLADSFILERRFELCTCAWPQLKPDF